MRTTPHFHASRHISSMACVAAAVCLLVLQQSACTHEPFLSGPVTPIDTTGNPGDTTAFKFCDPDTVYFEKDVLPILISNCSVPGCHDAITRQDGVVLTSYDKVVNTGDVRPFNLSGSDLYEVITENDNDKRMPPPPRNRLTTEQIQVIRTWIQQGAKDLTCDPDTLCLTDNVSFAQTVNPIIATNCRGCHSGPTPTGGISLESYQAIRAMAQSGQLYGAIAHLPGYVPMPRNRGPLRDCEIAQIKSWIDAGMFDN